ncbi:hypothetical protein [Pararhodobacter oceanensis]|uniref:hypothetical protein n=1 Tax=Pararhodobacter oceanensis TaxID=2172121 RepID=UPI003A91EBA0
MVTLKYDHDLTAALPEFLLQSSRLRSGCSEARSAPKNQQQQKPSQFGTISAKINLIQSPRGAV